MNIVITITKPLTAYRDDLFKALKATGPYTDDEFIVVCSTHEKDFNTDTYDMLLAFTNNVRMVPYSLAPYDEEARTIDDYMNEVMGYNLWRLKITGETVYLPATHVPTLKGWSKVIRDEFRQAGTSFYGPMTGQDSERWINGPFVCDAEFITSNPCIRGYNKNEMFMYRARHYTNRSCAPTTVDYYTYTPIGEEQGLIVTEETVPKHAAPEEEVFKDEVDTQSARTKKAAKKKTAKKNTPKKKAKKKAAKKKALYKKTEKPSIEDTLNDFRGESTTDS